MEIKTASVVSKDPKYHGGEPFTINEDDFDPEKHELFDAEKAAEAETKPKGKKNEPKQ